MKTSKIIATLLTMIMVVSMTGCAWLESKVDRNIYRFQAATDTAWYF